MAMPVEADALSARCEMMRMRSRPLPAHRMRSSLRVAMYGSDSVVGCEAPAGALAASLALARVCAAAGRDDKARLKVGSMGEGE
eukprot:2929151-Pleurochrysis_carterae.AAC.1